MILPIVESLVSQHARVLPELHPSYDNRRRTTVLPPTSRKSAIYQQWDDLESVAAARQRAGRGQIVRLKFSTGALLKPRSIDQITG